MSDHWTDRLSEYIDGELSPRERGALERHIAECDACRDVLAELRRVVTAAAALPDVAPDADLWGGIAAAMNTDIAASRASAEPSVTNLANRRGIAGRRVSVTVSQLAAAGIALVMLSGGAVWFAMRAAAPEPVAVEPPGSVRQVDTRSQDSYYEVTIRQLEAALDENREQLDPATVAVIEENIRTIDRAIFDARTALEQDPSNLFLNQHLENTMKRKIQLLKRATSMRGVRG